MLAIKLAEEADGSNSYNLEDTLKNNSESTHFLDFRSLEIFVNKVKSFVVLSKNYFDELKWQYSDYEITDMWATISPPNNYHRPHTHSNNILSGVFYIKSDESANIVFADPRPQAHVLEPKINTWQLNNAPNWSYPSTVNRLILFPSYLTHHVPVNKSNQNRISVAFNLMFKGKVGDSKEYQSANF